MTITNKTTSRPRIDARKAMAVDAEEQADWTTVENKDPQFHYSWADELDSMQIATMKRRGYVPTMTAEVSHIADKSGDGPTYELRIGHRLLMKCPREKAMARRIATATRYSTKPETDGEAAAQKMNATAHGVRVENLSETMRRK